MSEAEAEPVRADSRFLGGLGSPGASLSPPCHTTTSSVGQSNVLGHLAWMLASLIIAWVLAQDCLCLLLHRAVL